MSANESQSLSRSGDDVEKILETLVNNYDELIHARLGAG
jgi:hypothetical protein